MAGAVHLLNIKQQGERLGEVLQDMYLKMCMVIPVLMMTSLQMGNLHWSMSCA